MNIRVCFLFWGVGVKGTQSRSVPWKNQGLRLRPLTLCCCCIDADLNSCFYLFFQVCASVKTH